MRTHLFLHSRATPFTNTRSILVRTVGLAICVTVSTTLSPAPAAAQSTSTEPAEGQAERRSPAHTHVHHVSVSFRGTPDNQGILPTAVAEAEIAVQHATLAIRDPSDLEAMKRHAGHVLHALDPTQVERGPGQGYGAIRAAERAAHYIGLAAASVGATPAIETHAEHIETAASHAAAKGSEAAELAAQILEAEEAEDAAEMLSEVVELTRAMLEGADADGNGRIGWQEGEGGLAQAAQHLQLLRNAEGLSGR